MPDVSNLRRRAQSRTGGGSPALIDSDSGDQLGAWLRASGQGDPGAFAKVYDELSGLIFGIVRKVIRDIAQSEVRATG